MPRPATLDHLRKAKQAVQRTVVISLDDDLAAEYEEAVSERRRLETLLKISKDNVIAKAELEEITEKVLALEAQLDEVTVSFKFRSVGRAAFEELLLAHPPTKDQKDDAKKQGVEGRLSYNVETFPICLVAAASAEPKLSDEEVKELWHSDQWNQAELMQLFDAALSCNTQRRVLDLGKGS